MRRADDPDFRVIKSRVTILDVCARKNIELRGNQHQKTGKCPLPVHTSEDRDTFKVGWSRESKQWVWSCHSSSCVAARGGKKKGGDLIEFVQWLEALRSLREAGQKLVAWFGPFTDDSLPGPPSEEVYETYPDGDINKPLRFVLKDPNPKDPYLHVRGFEEEECEYLGVGFHRGRGLMEGRIIFPIHNENGKLIAYAGRSTDREVAHQERWRFPAGFQKSRALYNLHRVEGDEVIVVESFWGVLACVRAGIFNCVSIMGTSVSEWQAEMLAHRFRKVTLMLDGDEYGREAVSKAVERLVSAEVENIDPVFLPKGVQPDELTPDELRRFLKLPNIIYRWSVPEPFLPAEA